jgi:hypothetical protein
MSRREDASIRKWRGYFSAYGVAPGALSVWAVKHGPELGSAFGGFVGALGPETVKLFDRFGYDLSQIGTDSPSAAKGVDGLTDSFKGLAQILEHVAKLPNDIADALNRLNALALSMS